MKNFPLVIFLTSIFFLLSSTFAEENSYRKAIEGLDPMDLSEVDPKVAGLLRKYYQYTYGDLLTWESIESLRFKGKLLIGKESFSYTAYQKKPNYSKFVIDLDNGGSLTFAYDGKEAWQLELLSLDAKAVSMPDAEARNFIRGAVMGGHLLYPQLKGKQFEFVGASLVEDDRVYELKTTLPDGQVIRSFFDMTSFAELYQISVNNVDGSEELNIHTDFRKVEGMRVPFLTTLKVNGEQVHQMRVTELQINKGVTPWIFGRSDHPSKIASTPGLIESNSMQSSQGSSFGFEAKDIWSTDSGVVGSAFQIESVNADEDSNDSDADDLNQESGESEK